MPCKLQYWDTLTAEFVNYVSFDLSEHSSKTLQLPKVSKETRSRLVAAHVWRVFICRPDDMGVIYEYAPDSYAPLL